MENKILKLLIVVCGLSLTVVATAVNYNFSKDGSVSRTTQLQEFDVEQQSIQKITPQSSNSISTLTSGGSSSALNFSSLGRTVSTTAASSDGGTVGASAFSSQGLTSLYDGFDSQSAVATASNGPVKMPPTGPGSSDAFPPVGEGLVSLLLMAGFYAIKRCKK